MRPRTSSNLRFFAAFAAAWALFAAFACGPPERSVTTGDVRIRRVLGFEPPSARSELAAMAGDWVVESPRLRLLVGSLDRPPAERGAILEATSPELARDESIVRITPSVHVGRRRFRVQVDEMGIARGGRGRDALRISGHVTLPNGHVLGYARELTMHPRRTAVGIASSVHTRRGQVDVRFGSTIAWGGAVPWVPGVGEVVDDAWHDGSFVGTEGDSSGTVFGLEHGPIRMVAEYEQHGAHRFLVDTEVMGVPVRARRRSVSERAFLAIAPRGLSGGVRLLGWLRGAPFPEAHVRLPYAPRGSFVRVAATNHAVLERARPDDAGEVVLPLPPVVDRPAARFVAVAGAPGHAESDPVAFAPNAHLVMAIPHGGHARIRAFDAANGHPLPARARFVPLDGTGPLDLGPDGSARGALDTVVLADGRGLVPLRPGRYRVFVSHGPEWTLSDTTIAVTEAYRPDVLAKLVHVVEPGGWIGCDLHVHAAPSPDSTVSLEDRVASLVAEGIGFAVPTDHNHVSDYAPAALELGFDESAFLTTTGVEVTTIGPHFGHFNAYPFAPDPREPHGGAPRWEGVDAVELFRGIRERAREAVIQVNHPRMEGEIGYFDRSGYDPLTGRATGRYSAEYDLLEVWNGFDLARAPSLARVFGDWIAMVARGRRVTAVGSSDSHRIRTEWAGYPRTYVLPRERTPAAIVEALRAGHAFVTDGPFLEATIDEAGPGDLATAHDGRVRVHVRVRTPGWMSIDRIEIWAQGAKVHDAPIAPVRPLRGTRRPASDLVVYEVSVDLEAHEDLGFVVVARGERNLDEFFGKRSIPPLAFTNPIWVDADGDGQGPVDPGDEGDAREAASPRP